MSDPVPRSARPPTTSPRSHASAAPSAPPPPAATLPSDASALSRAASEDTVATLRAGQDAAAPAAVRDLQALRLLDALGDAHVAAGRAPAEVTSRFVRDLGSDGLVRLAARVSASQVTAAFRRHGASATEAHVLTERLGANVAEGLHVAVYDAVLAGLESRLTEVRAANAPAQRASTTRAVLTGQLDVYRQLAAVGQHAAATELGELAVRYRDAAPAQRPAIAAHAEELVAGALSEMERVLSDHVAWMPSHLRQDQLLDLPRAFPEVFRRVAREAGLGAQAAASLASGTAGTSMLERAWGVRVTAAGEAQRVASTSRASLVALGELASALDSLVEAKAATRVFRLTLHAAEDAVLARDRGLLVAGFLVAHPLSP